MIDLQVPLFPLLWTGIISLCIIMYVILDGFTLGTGILMPALNKHEKDIAISVILPTWDGNQTWLVLGTAALYGAFPFAFSLLLPAFYVPLLFMVIALLFRGVVFEFRLKSQRGRRYWDIIFSLSSLVITLIQGLMLGNYIKGFDCLGISHELIVPSFFNFFSIFSALSLVAGYLLLSSTRLILKTEGSIQSKMYNIALWSLIIITFAILVVSLWSPLLNPFIFKRWFKNFDWAYLMILPLVTLIILVALFSCLKRKFERLPFYLSIILFLCPYIGFIISIYPFIIPYQFSFIEMAAPTATLKFIFIGAAIMLPLLLMYTGYSYHIFKGKVKNGIGY